MKDENREALLNEFPGIFVDRENGRRFHFECGDGWYNLIYATCAAIRSYVNSENSDRDRYFMIRKRKEDGEEILKWMEPYLEGDIPEVMEYPQATQIKEKFGGLRFYTRKHDDRVQDMITVAEYLSEMTCEVCGAPGERRGGGWVKTLCDTHHKEREESRR